MKIGSVALSTAFVALLTLTALRWMAPAPVPSVPGRMALPELALPAAHAGERTFFLPVTEPQAAAAPQARGIHWREMQDQLEHAPSLRAFYYEALRHPEEGGYYYAIAAIGACKDRPATDKPASARQQQVRDALRARCDFSAQEREDAWNHFGAMRNTRFEDDPLLDKTFALLKAQDADARANILRSALAEGNPYLSASLIQPALAARIAEGASDSPAAADLPDAAQTLVACRLGAECGPDSMAARMLCLEHGWCGGDVSEALREGLGADFVRIDGLAGQAVIDIRKGELARLVQLPRPEPQVATR